MTLESKEALSIWEISINSKEYKSKKVKGIIKTIKQKVEKLRAREQRFTIF